MILSTHSFRILAGNDILLCVIIPLRELGPFFGRLFLSNVTAFCVIHNQNYIQNHLCLMSLRHDYFKARTTGKSPQNEKKNEDQRGIPHSIGHPNMVRYGNRIDWITHWVSSRVVRQSRSRGGYKRREARLWNCEEPSVKTKTVVLRCGRQISRQNNVSTAT
jgi:hypothetical protein